MCSPRLQKLKEKLKYVDMTMGTWLSEKLSFVLYVKDTVKATLIGTNGSTNIETDGD